MNYLPANTSSPAPTASEPTARRRRLGALLRIVGVLLGLCAMVTFTLVYLAAPRQPSSRSTVQVIPTAAATPEETADAAPTGAGNAIIRDCFAVDEHNCLTANPKLHAALDLLKATSTGPDLLVTAAKSGVSIRLGAVRASAVAIFDPNRHIVTVDSRYAGFSARGLAAVLAHELRHVSNWSGVTGIVQPLTRWNCYTDEASAFTTEIAVWKEIKGGGPPADRLELEENDIAREMDTRGLGFWLSMTDSYHSECA